MGVGSASRQQMSKGSRAAVRVCRTLSKGQCGILPAGRVGERLGSPPNLASRNSWRAEEGPSPLRDGGVFSGSVRTARGAALPPRPPARRRRRCERAAGNPRPGRAPRCRRWSARGCGQGSPRLAESRQECGRSDGSRRAGRVVLVRPSSARRAGGIWR